jgi:hypothetical protein
MKPCWVGKMWGFKFFCNVPLFLKTGIFGFGYVKHIFLQCSSTWPVVFMFWNFLCMQTFLMYKGPLHDFFDIMMVWRWFTWSRIYPSKFEFGCFPGLVACGTMFSHGPEWGQWTGAHSSAVMAERKPRQAVVFDGLEVFIHSWLCIFSSYYEFIRM